MTDGNTTPPGARALRVVGGIFLLLPLAGVMALLWCARDTVDLPAAFHGTALRLPGPATHVRASYPFGDTSKTVDLRLADDRHSAWLTSIPPGSRTRVTLSVDLQTGSTVPLEVVVVPRWEGYVAGALSLLAVFGVVLWLKPTAPRLLAVDGRLSLSRMQLLIWTSLTAGMLGSAVPLLSVPDVDWSTALLVLTSGTTAALSPLAGKSEAPDPKLRTMLSSSEDGGLDISRVQHFCIVLVAAFLVLADFLHHLRMPQLSEGFIGLLAASQATYLGTKAASARRSET